VMHSQALDAGKRAVLKDFFAGTNQATGFLQIPSI